MSFENMSDFKPSSRLKTATRLLAERSLLEFIRQAWSIVEPGTKFIEGHHIEAIALHLEAVTRREIRNLLINIPPRCAKSLTVSVFWPCWVWTTKPETRWLFASYADSLSIRDSLKCRRIIESPWYKENWGKAVKMTGDQNAKGRFENTRTGYRLATSVDGTATGEGGDMVIVDDPHNVRDGESEPTRTATLRWWDEVMSSRLNDQNTGCKVIIMQRVHANDLSAHVMARGYEHLMLPMEFEPDRKCRTNLLVDGKPWEDWRTQEGELLWPARIGPEALATLKRELGSYATAGQLQQRPAPRGGGMFKREWFEIVDAAPAEAQRVRYWDRAGGEKKDSDWTAGCKMARTAKKIFYVEDMVRLQGSPLKVESAIVNTASRDGAGVQIGLEQDPGQAGKADVGYLIRQLAGYPVKAIPVTKSKELRAGPAVAQAEAGNIKLVRAAWNEAFLAELETFPMGTNDDQVDGFSGAFNYLAQTNRIMLI